MKKMFGITFKFRVIARSDSDEAIQSRLLDFSGLPRSRWSLAMTRGLGVLGIMVLFASACYAYETVCLKFPDNMGWRKVYYVGGKKEALVQYAPRGESHEFYNETVVYHSYKSKKKPTPALARARMEKQMSIVKQDAKNLQIYPVQVNKYDTMLYWCADKMGDQPGQCEIVRATPTYEGVILIHYINKSRDDFMNKKDEWIERVRSAKTYWSYYRNDIILGKDMYFEL